MTYFKLTYSNVRTITINNEKMEDVTANLKREMEVMRANIYEHCKEY